jgi:hypothetical protein
LLRTSPQQAGDNVRNDENPEDSGLLASPARAFVFEAFLGRGGFGMTVKARSDPVRHLLPSNAQFCVVALLSLFFFGLRFFAVADQNNSLSKRQASQCSTVRSIT